MKKKKNKFEDVVWTKDTDIEVQVVEIEEESAIVEEVLEQAEVVEKETPVEVKKEKVKKEVKEEVVQAVVEENEDPTVGTSQTQKKHGWMVNERSQMSRRYFQGKGTRY